MIVADSQNEHRVSKKALAMRVECCRCCHHMPERWLRVGSQAAPVECRVWRKLDKREGRERRVAVRQGERGFGRRGEVRWRDPLTCCGGLGLTRWGTKVSLLRKLWQNNRVRVRRSGCCRGWHDENNSVLKKVGRVRVSGGCRGMAG